MSIIVIRGPRFSAAAGTMPPALPREVLGGLVGRAVGADRTVSVRACSSEADLLHALLMARQARAEIVLLAPGSCVHSPQLEEALKRLGLPYIEVHDDSCECPEAVMSGQSGSRLALVNGYMAQSYTLALDIALEHLGCSEYMNEVHVGT